MKDGNGTEIVKHPEIAKDLENSFYFCKLNHSWERGAMRTRTGSLAVHFKRNRFQ